jgi:hypothetical protein
MSDCLGERRGGVQRFWMMGIVWHLHWVELNAPNGSRVVPMVGIS